MGLLNPAQVGSNALALIIMGGIGWIIWQKVKGNKIEFGRFLNKFVKAKNVFGEKKIPFQRRGL